MKNFKKKVRNLLIYGFWLTGMPAIRRWWLKSSSPLVRVLAYHDVPESKRDDFRRHITYLQKHYNLITPEDFRRQDFAEDEINILLTFDDGYRSWSEVVLPILQEKGLGGIFFVASGFVDTAGNQKAEEQFCHEHLNISHRPPLSWDQVREVDGTLHCAIGGHTRTHPRLDELAQKEAYREIQVDKNKIENQLDHQIRHFAFPYGKQQDIGTAKHLPQKAGYEHSFSTEIDFLTTFPTNNEPLPRTMIEPDMSNFLLSCFVGGVYDLE